MEVNLDALASGEGANAAASAEALSSEQSPSPPAKSGGAGVEGDCGESSTGLYNGGSQSESVSALNDSPLVFFSLEDARKLVAERDRLLIQYEEVNRKVEALSVLVPDNMREKIFGGRTGVGSGHPVITAHGNGAVTQVTRPLADAIVELLDETLEVMSQDQIEEAVWEMPEFSDREKYPVEDIAKALEKISRRGRAVKRGSNYFSKSVAEENIPGYGGPTIVQATEKLLKEVDESLEAWEVIDRLKQDPNIGERIKESSKGVYNALSRLTSRRIVYRDVDGGYRIRAK